VVSEHVTSPEDVTGYLDGCGGAIYTVAFLMPQGRAKPTRGLKLERVWQMRQMRGWLFSHEALITVSAMTLVMMVRFSGHET